MWNSLPNLLSATRLLFSPLLLFVPEAYLLFLFLPLALSDALDGFLARRLRAQTELGKMLDPLADKVMLLCGLFVCVFRIPLIPEWLFYGVLARDVFLLLGGALLSGKRGRFVQARLPGKAFTFLLSLFILFCLIGLFNKWLLWATTFMLVLSWVDYALFGVRSLATGRRSQRECF